MTRFLNLNDNNTRIIKFTKLYEIKYIYRVCMYFSYSVKVFNFSKIFLFGVSIIKNFIASQYIVQESYDISLNRENLYTIETVFTFRKSFLAEQPKKYILVTYYINTNLQPERMVYWLSHNC